MVASRAWLQSCSFQSVPCSSPCNHAYYLDLILTSGCKNHHISQWESQSSSGKTMPFRPSSLYYQTCISRWQDCVRTSFCCGMTVEKFCWNSQVVSMARRKGLWLDKQGWYTAFDLRRAGRYEFWVGLCKLSYRSYDRLRNKISIYLNSFNQNYTCFNPSLAVSSSWRWGIHQDAVLTIKPFLCGRLSSRKFCRSKLDIFWAW